MNLEEISTSEYSCASIHDHTMEKRQENNTTYALADQLERSDLDQSKTTKDVITTAMLRSTVMSKAYCAIKPVLEEINRTLDKHPQIRKAQESGIPVNKLEITIPEKGTKVISLKPFKHFIENFVHTMSQMNMRIQYTGTFGHTYDPTTFKFTTEFDTVEIAVTHPSMATRTLWACAIIVSSICKLLETLAAAEKHLRTMTNMRHEMENEPKQAIEDTMAETEVVTVGQNTAITQEVEDSENVHLASPSYTLQEVATTETLAKLAPIAERFVRIFNTPQTFNITDQVSANKFVLDIPNSLYSFFDSTVVSALRSYTLIRTDVEILIKVNANQAQCGRYIVSHMPCEKQMVNQTDRGTNDSVFRMLQRDHAVIDLSKSNDVVYTMRYENLRPWLPIQADEIGTIIGGSFATLRMRCLSPLRVADTGNPVCPYQVFARLKNTVLAGMRFPVSLPTPNNDIVARHEMQSEPEIEYSRGIQGTRNLFNLVKAIPMVGTIFGTTGKILGNGAMAVAKWFSKDLEHVKEVEDKLNYIGMINKDRPVDIAHPKALLPLPVHSYSYGRTAYHSKKLRLEPEATVPHFPDHITVGDTQNILDIAQTPGFVTRFIVNETSTQGDLLVELPAIPYDPRYRSIYPVVGLSSEIAVPPVTYTSFMYTQYSGSIIYEFVPVKTPSHNFSIQVGFVPFNGAPGEVTETQLQSCRWKVIDFRTSENGEFTVPWLSTGVVRGYPYPYSGYASVTSDFVNNNTFMEGMATQMKDPGKVVVRLVNELNPTPIVSPTIEVLVFVKAHPNMRFMSPTNFKASSVYFNDMNVFTRSVISSTAYGPSIMPAFHSGNFDWNVIRYEMQKEPKIVEREVGLAEVKTDLLIAGIESNPGPSPMQKGDEQTMQGEVLREAPGPYIQTMEDHHNILDICRRFNYSVTVEGVFSSKLNATATSPFPPFAVVPITPYSQSISPFNFTSPPLVRRRPLNTTRDAILNCFRWMRGSMNITIHSLTNMPLEITYVPPVDYPYAISSYTGISPVYSSNLAFPIYSTPMSTGLPSEILDPRVNPIQTIEVPFYHNNNYLDLQCAIRKGTTTPTVDRNRLQDIFASYLGNLVIRGVQGDFIDINDDFSSLTPHNFKVRVSVAFGDDCKLQHFIGVPPININSAGIRWTMIEPTTGFKNRNQTREEIETELIRGGIESNPGPTFSTFFQSDSLSRPLTSMTSMLTEFKNLVRAPQRLSQQMEDIKARGVGFVEEVKRILAAYTEGISILQITTLALSIVSALHKSTNLFAMLSVICQIFTCVGIFNVGTVDAVLSKMTHVVTNNIEDTTIRHEMENDSLTSMASVFASLIIESFIAYNGVDKSKVAIDESYVKTVFVRSFKNFNVMRVGALCILLSRVCAAVRTLYNTVRKWVRGLEKHDILTDDPEFIQGFMKDYEFFMDERNLSSQSIVQAHRDRFWSTLLAAYYLRGVLATVDKKHVNSTLATAVKDIIMRANSLKSHMMAPPVRYEPFSLWLWGAPGTGKSKMMSELTIDMAKSVGCKLPGDPIYVRSPHSQWWNGYDGQPIVVIDDANGVNDPTILGRMVSEYQAMKTSAKMRLEMPRLEEKNAEMTSIILGVSSNCSEWISSMIVDRNAFRRRRDVVAQVMWSETALNYFRENPTTMRTAAALPPGILEDDKHLVFLVHNNPGSGSLDGVIKNKQEFREHLLEYHRNYHSVEVDRMMTRYMKSLELAQQMSENIMDRTTLKSALLAVLLGCENQEVMSETMKRALFELEHTSPQRYSQLPLHTRNILQQIKKSEIRHEAPSHANIGDLVRMYSSSSEWFKTVLFPAYTVGNGWFDAISKEFKPWKYEEQRMFNNDLITSNCASCREEHNMLDRKVSYICVNSVEENQHWVCSQCKPAFENALNEKTCPVCRSTSLVRITEQQNDWRWHMKVAHFARTTASKMTMPIIRSAEFLWKYSTTLSAIFMMSTITYIKMSEYYHRLREVERLDEAVYHFLSQYGILPDTYYMNNDVMYLGVGDAYFKDEGDFQFQPFINESHEGPTTSEERPRGTELNIPSCSSRSSSSSESESKQFHSPPEFDYLEGMDKVECVTQHEEESNFMKIRKGKAIIHYEEGNFYANVRNGEEMSRIEIPAVSCTSEACRWNRNMVTLVTHYYASRVGSWEDALRCNRPVFDDDDPVPDFIQNIFNDSHAIEEIQPERKWYVKMIEYQQELLRSLKGKFLSWLITIYEVLCDKWKYILGFITMSFALYYGIKYYYDEDDGIVLEPRHEGASSPRETGKGKAKPNTRMYNRSNQQRATHEMKMVMNDKIPENVQNIANIVLKNQYSISCAGFTVYGVAFKNNYGWFPRHSFYLFSQLQDSGETLVFKQGDVTEVIKDRFGMHIVEENIVSDYVIFQHKRLTGRDLRTHIYTTIQEVVAYPSYAYGVDLTNQKINPIHIINVTQVPPEEAKELTTPWTVKGKTYKYTSKLIEYLTVVGFRGDGKCGSPMISAEGKIIAIHFAGSVENGSDVGYSAPIFREQFMMTDSDMKHEMMAFPNLKLHAHYPNPPYHTNRSKITPSAIADKAWPSLTQPCIQSHLDPRYTGSATPLLDGASTIGAPTNPPKQHILNQAIRAVSDELIANMPTPAMAPPVSLEEAVTAQNHSNVEPMNLSTSAGLPWIADFPSKNLKSHYIVHDVINDRHKVKFDDTFLTKYNHQWNGRKLGIPPREPFWAHLKDERRKPEKIATFGSTRVFSVSPLELVVSCRRALLPMMDAFHSDPVKLHHAIGLSPDSRQWTQLIESLRKKSNKIIQLDFKKFSDSMPWAFVKGAFGVIANYYSHHNLMTPELLNILNTLYYEITRSLILVDSTVYEILNGVLQGHPITSLINSIVNMIEQVYVWIDITDLAGSVFFKECGLVVMGDDVVISVPKRYLRHYNGQTIASKFSELNIVVTDENKQVDVISKYQDISRFDFLSCSYYLHPYRKLYLAPSDPESIFDTALWIKRKDGPFHDATLENVEQSLMNCFGHGPCIYEMYRATLEHLTGTSFRSWFELDYLFYGVDGDPERSVITTNLGVVTGTSPKQHDQLEARVGRTDRTSVPSTSNQYFDAEFLMNVRLDTHGIVAGKYKCKCRYDCEKELLSRIKHVESKTNTPRTQFLPFTSQEEGTEILGAAIDVERTVKSRGYPSIIAIESDGGVTSDSAVGVVDGTRDRVLFEDSSTEIEIVGLQIISYDSDVIPGGLVVSNIK